MVLRSGLYRNSKDKTRGYFLTIPKWKHYEGEIILLTVRWHLKDSLSYRNLEEMMAEREIEVDHKTIMRWIHQYSLKSKRRYVNT
jgi:transposase-like protein